MCGGWFKGCPSGIIQKNIGSGMMPLLDENRSVCAPARGSLLAYQGSAVGMVGYKRQALKGRPMMKPSLEWIGQVRVHLQGALFLGMVVPWRCHGLRVECPFQGRQIMRGSAHVF